MSRYLVNKFIYKVDGNEAALKEYMRDPAGFVTRWEQEEGPQLSASERTSGHHFTDEERRAYLAESIFLNQVKYENDKLEAYLRKLK